MMSEIAVRGPGDEIAGPVDSWVEVLVPVFDLADRLARTAFVPKELQGKPEAVAAAILFGREVGLPPMKALSEINVINGRPSISATGMRALVVAAGHTIVVERWTDESCALSGYRRGEDDPAARVTWTVADAQRAGLTARNPNWKTQPRAMLLARATSELCRAAFPDVITGLSSVEEMDETGGQQSPRTTVRRQSAARAEETTIPPQRERATTQNPPGPEPPASQKSGGSEEEPRITTKQSRLLHARLREVGLGDRAAGLAAISELVGREITTTSDLTVAEASLVIDRVQPPPSDVVDAEVVDETGQEPLS